MLGVLNAPFASGISLTKNVIEGLISLFRDHTVTGTNLSAIGYDLLGTIPGIG